jgi:hypothetical protein
MSEQDNNFVSYSNCDPVNVGHSSSDGHVGKIEVVTNSDDVPARTMTYRESKMATTCGMIRHRATSNLAEGSTDVGMMVDPFENTDPLPVMPPNSATTKTAKQYPDPFFKQMSEKNMKLIYEHIGDITVKPGQQLDDGTFATVSNMKFPFDATGSMQRFIDGAKETLLDVVEAEKKNLDDVFSKLHPGKKFTHFVRICVCAYRDYCDKTMLEVLPPTTDMEYVKHFLSRLEADGGGDEPENMLAGFTEILGEKFGENNEFTRNTICLIADAPAHGSFMHNVGEDDNYDHEKEKWMEVLYEMKKQNNDFMVVKFGFSIENSIDFMREYYNEKDKFEIVVKDLSDTGVNHHTVRDALIEGSGESCGFYYMRSSAE